jgi:DNA-binding NarL/FixJ family response regulator
MEVQAIMAVGSDLTFPGAVFGTAPAPALSRLRTVVVDDSDTFLQVTFHLLDLEEVIDVVAAASDGVEAIDTVVRLKPALLLMDVSMPGLDGLSVSSLLAQMSWAPRVVLMSSEDSPELRAASERAGALAFVHKANFRREFEEVLERLFENRRPLTWRATAGA